MKHLFTFIYLVCMCAFVYAQDTVFSTFRQVHNFEVGDTFQYEFQRFNIGGSDCRGYGYSTEIIVGRIDFSDRVVYAKSILKKETILCPYTYPNTHYNLDTFDIEIVNLDSSIFFNHDTFSIESCGNDCHIDSVFWHLPMQNRKMNEHFEGGGLSSNNIIYGDGLGMVKNHEFSDDFDWPQGYTELVYYRKKNGETWGALYVINYVGISDNELDNKPIVYSYSGMVTASLPSAPLANTSFTIYNLTGQALCSHLLEAKLTNIPLSTLPAGMYLWRIEEAGKTLGTGKLITQ